MLLPIMEMKSKATEIQLSDAFITKTDSSMLTRIWTN